MYRSKDAKKKKKKMCDCPEMYEPNCGHFLVKT